MPFADGMQKVHMQIITMPVPARDGITHDNVTVRVDASPLGSSSLVVVDGR